MHAVKKKISVSLDSTLVEELEGGSESVSAQVNAAVRAELERRRQQRLLGKFLDELDAVHGPVPEHLIQKYLRLFQ